jgi:hypothetical protein
VIFVRWIGGEAMSTHRVRQCIVNDELRLCHQQEIPWPASTTAWRQVSVFSRRFSC